MLVPLYHDGAQWQVVLNVRSMRLAEHKGEIAFPGGSMEESDADAQACALREAWEEMGIRPEAVDVLGPLDTVLTRTGFIVWPTVGAIPYPYGFKPDLREVAEVVHAPLRAFLDSASLRCERRTERDGAAADRVAYAWAGRLVYGATAVILTQLLDAVRGAEQADAA
ncbi:MAG: CoA pyrophosphatase [Dehalococcoidia bacterium]|nr:CoA pyrophosphatase [Dehalococcoidia bacterium]